MKSNSQLETEIAQLREEKDKLMEALRIHLCARHQQVPEHRLRNAA